MRSPSLLAFLLFILILSPAVSAEDTLDWYTRGQTAAATGDYTLAITYYNNALAQDPKFPPALAGKAAALNALHDYTTALTTADASLALRSSDAVALNARALALYGMGRYAESITAYDRLFVVQQNKADAYCYQADAYYRTGQFNNSIIAYKDHCTKLDPVNFMGWNNLGLAYMRVQNYPAALSAFTEGTGIKSGNATLWNNKGLALKALGQPQDALQCFNKAVGLDPMFSEAEKNRDDMIGRQQSYTIKGTITPLPTISRIGTLWTTPVPVSVTPVPAITQAGDVTPPAPDSTPAETTPVPKRTTYSPVSFPTIIGALAVAGCLALSCSRK